MAKDEAIMEAAAALLARAQSGSASPAEVDAWVDASPAHAAAFARVEAAWERAERLKALPAADLADEPGFQPTRRMAAALAVGVLGLGGAGAWVLGRRPTEATVRGERRTVSLPDGSRVELNTDSVIKVAYSEGRRDIVLARGEALFDVAKDPTRPFVVRAGEAEVRALGTAFNIRLREKVVELTVTEGVVAVEEHAAVRTPARQVVQGRGAVIATGAVAEVDLDPEVLRRRLLWRDGVVEFEGDTLEQAAAEFNRYNERRLVVADPQVASIRVGGRFGTHEVDRFLTALQAGFPVRAVPGDEGVTYLVHAS
jgi:transmembrane sensor